MFALLCFCVATEFSVNKDLYYIKVCVRLLAPVPQATVHGLQLSFQLERQLLVTITKSSHFYILTIV